MSKKIKDEQKKFLGETLNQYDKALDEAINQLDKKNREQNHKISSLVNSFDNEYLEKDVEGNMTTLENSKDGMVIINEIQGSTEVNYCKDGEKELILNGDIDTQGESFVTITEGVDGGLVDVSLEGNTEVNLSKTKDPVLVTREFDDINCNVGKLQYTIDDVTTINDEPGKVDIDRIVGDTMVNHAVNGSEELILNAHINESGDNNITLNGVTSDGGKVDVALEGNTLVNVSNVKDDYITPSIEDKVDKGSVISLPEVSEGLIHIDEIEGNTMVNYCTDGAKELTLNGGIDVEGTFVTTTEGVDGGLVDVALEGNTLVNLVKSYSQWQSNTNPSGNIFNVYRRYSSDIGIQPNTTYTVIINNMSKYCTGYSIFQYTNSEGVTKTISCQLIDNKYFTINLTDISKPLTKLVIYQKYNDVEGNEVPDANDEFYILEGDWTNKEIPQYFEGMKSVGQDDENGHKVEILSTTNNLLDLSLIDGLVVEDDKIVAKKAVMNCNTSLKLRPNTKYKVTMEKYDDNPSWIGFGYTANGVYTFIGNTGNQPNKVIEFTTPNEKNIIFYAGANSSGDIGHYLRLMKLEYANSSSNSTIAKHNKKEIPLNEPLRSLPNGTKDRFVKIGGKWFIERKCGILSINGSTSGWSSFWTTTFPFEGTSVFSSTLLSHHSNFIICDKYRYVALESGEVGYITGRGGEGTIGFRVKNTTASTVEEWVNYLNTNEINIIYQLKTPIYEPLEIEPTLNTYNDTTHISNNSIIPCNMQIKNTGYNCILKPSTLYTVAVDTNESGTIGINLGGAEATITNNVATITTPSTLTDDSLRLYGKGIKGSKVRLLEGDKTNWIPSFFEGMKSSFEDKVQEDGSYKIEIMSKDGNLIDIKHQALINKASGMSCDFIIYKDLPCWQIRTQSYTEYYNYFRCKYEQNTQYSLSFDCEMVEYDDDRVGVEISVIYADGTIQRTIIIKDTKRVEITTLPDKTVQRIRFQSWGYGGILNMYNMQLIKSDTPKTTMEKSNKVQLSSLEPLRGVGDVHDRLVFKDGKLMIERNCGALTIDSSQGFIRETKYNNGNLYGFEKDFSDIKPSPLWYKAIVCDKYSYYTYTDDAGMKNLEGEWIGSWSNNIDRFVIMLRLRTKENTLDSLNEYLNENPISVVYIKKEPTYEEIPYDLQKIILESYANGTLFFDTNIPPTKVSFNCFEEELTYLYPSTSYTLQFNSNRNTTADVNLGGTQLLAQSIVKGLNRISITTPSTLANNKLIIDGAGAKISEVVVTDTDREFMYFEEMKSVGECEELEVKSVNKNLFDINLLKPVRDSLYGYYEFNPNGIAMTLSITDKDPSVSISELYIGFTENGVNAIGGFEWSIADGDINHRTFTTPNMKYISFYPNTQSTLDKLFARFNFQLEEGNTATDYIPHASNTQTLAHEPLRAVGNVKDRYVLIDGKWYIERRCGKVSSDGNNTVKTDVYGGQRGSRFKVKCPNVRMVSQELVISNKFQYMATTSSWQTEGQYIATDEFVGDLDYALVRLNDDLTVDEFLRQHNDLVIVYPLATPTYEPIDYNPFTVYSDITHISNNSTIPCNMIIKNHGYNMVALKENTSYTLYVNKNTTNALTYRLGDYVEINSLNKFTFTTPSTLTDKTLRIDSKGAKVKDLMLIEGTPTNDPVGYFDGLKSSYECEKVTDESDENYGKYKVETIVRGKNLLNQVKLGGINISNGIEIVNNDAMMSIDFIKIDNKLDYIFSMNGVTEGVNYYFYDNNKKYISYKTKSNGLLSSINDTPSNCVYIKIGRTAKLDATLQLEEGTVTTEYEPYFESKQTVYLNSPLLKDDEIVWKDNKIQHYHKMHRVVFDGSDDEGWGSVESKGNNIKFGKAFSSAKYFALHKCPLKCDNFITQSAIFDESLYEMATIYGHSEISKELRLSICKSKLQTQDLQGFKQWLQQNPTTVVYPLATPYYEEISDYPLKLNVIANSSLSTESTIQVTNISFNIYEETLPYLYPNTKYYITFNADVDRNNIIIDLGGNHVVLDCKVGFNKVEITTPSDTTNLLTFSGTGVNIDHVKVTQQDIDEYFEGMKSVGECENNTLEIICKNNDNSKSNTQTLTHEPLRAVGDIKDRYVLIDGKWYIERNCGSYTATGNEPIYEYLNSYSLPVSYFIIYNNTFRFINSNCISNKFKNIAQAWNNNGKGIGVLSVTASSNENRVYFSNHTASELKSILNGFTIIYQLATPTYEPIDYNPFETYADTTHITTNSLIPTNVVVKNHGYNCILKPSTKYTIALNKPNGTISAKLGGSAKVDSTNSIFTITTPSTLNDNVLRLSGSGNVKDIIILEGDKTVNTPSYFEGIESVFEQEYDTEKGKYKVTAKVEGNGKESSITFYLNEPLRGTGTAKDKVFVEDGKVVVQRNCGSIILDGKAPNRLTGVNPGGYHTWTNSTGNTVNGYVYFNELIEGLEKKMIPNSKINCNTLPSNIGGHINIVEGIILTTNYFGFSIHKSKLGVTDVNDQQQNESKASEWFKNNPVTVVYQLAEPVYEEVDYDLSKLVLENYENSSLIFESNIPVSANIKYSGEVPVVTQAKALSSKVDNTTLDINENIIPYMCDIDYRIVELQLMNGDIQGEGIELLGIGDIEILSNENVLFNNREDKKYNYSYDMLKRDILSQRYSKEEYQYRLDRYLLAKKISDEEYKELEGLLNNGK